MRLQCSITICENKTIKGNKINKIGNISKGVLHVMADKKRLRPEQATFFRL